jgi:hypothetical protein
MNLFAATIENVSENTSEADVYDLVFVNNKGEEKAKVSIFIKSLLPNEKIEVNANINIDISYY